MSDQSHREGTIQQGTIDFLAVVMLVKYVGKKSMLMKNFGEKYCMLA